VIKPRTINVQRVLANIERALSRLVPETIHVHRVESEEDFYVNIDPTQLHQALLNLALNARDAMATGGHLFLEAGTEEVGSEAQPLLPGRYVTIRVRDTGTGMSPETQARIFEPFFTTKEPGLGTGLGLANVLESVKSASGHVTVSSELGKGSVLALYLPLVEARPSGIETKRATEHAAPRGKLLVVDDELQVREVIRTVLSDQGFEVRTADSAQAALEILRSEPMALLCTDIVMPEGSGIRLLQEARKHYPWLPIVICSAYGIDDELNKRVVSGDLALITKPFKVEELSKAVFKALTAAKQRRVSAVSEAS
jgi:CheY-like chemotaxis protein